MIWSNNKTTIESETEVFLNSAKGVCPSFTESELSLFASKPKFLDLKKKDIFLQSGEVQKALGFITKGLIRSFIIDQDGNERTVITYPYSSEN